MSVSVLSIIVVAAVYFGDIVVAFTVVPPLHQAAHIERAGAAITSGLFAKRIPRSVSAQSPGVGPKASSPRQRERSNAGPATTSTPERRRAPHQFDHTLDQPRPFVDALTEISYQTSNEDDPELLVLPINSNSGKLIEHAHFETRSLDDLFPGLSFSRQFASSRALRTDLRQAMREDIFDTTPAYHAMSEKARKILLLPDSSLQGSWKCRNGGWARRPTTSSTADDNLLDTTSTEDGAPPPRMERLTRALRQHLGEQAPTGDEFMDTIGALCGSLPQTHWIDIVGVLNRRVPHSWHQDTGRSPEGTAWTVLLGFPAQDDYDGVGVFSHLIRLQLEQWAPDDHPPNQPVLYGNLPVKETQIVRPRFAEGREIILYRDVDVLHSSPDVAHRASVMRFM